MSRSFPFSPIFAVTLVVFSLIAACGGDSSTDPASTGGGQITITLGAATGSALGALTLTGIPEATDPANIWAEITDPATGATTLSIITHELDSWSVMVPPHPATPMAGGEATLRITDGSKMSSNVVALTIDPLPSSEGAFSGVVDGLSGLLTSWLAAHGTSRTELDAADPGQLVDARAPLYLAYETIDMPGNANSLRAMADGTSPVIDQFGLNLADLDAVLGACGFSELLAIQQAGVDSLAIVLPEGSSPQTAKAGLVSAAELNDLMWKAQLASILNNENGQHILQRTGQAMAVIGLHPAMKAASIGVGASIWGYSKAVEASENLYPSRFLFSENDLSLSPDDFPEDDTEGGTWTLRPVAVSNGWTLDRAVLEGLVQYLGAGGGGNAQGQVIEQFMASQLGQDFAGMMVSEGLNQIIAGQLASPQDGIARIDPDQWTADVSEFCDDQVVDGAAVTISSPGHYATNEVGTARIRVAKKDGFFGYQGLLRFKPVTVNAINLNLDPDSIEVDPGEVVSLTATVNQANDTAVAWTHSGGSLVTSGLTATLTTPNERWAGAIEVEVESQSTGGLRASGEPRRFDTALVYCKQVSIYIAPAGICVDEGQQVPFVAEVFGYDSPYELEWTASAGSFSGDIYSATTVGPVTITATIIGTEHTGSASITVGNCVCSWEATLSGALSGTVGGSFATYESYTAEGGETGTTFFFRPSEFEDFPNFYVTLVPAIGAESIGTQAALTFFIPTDTGQPEWLSLIDEELGVTWPVLTISTNDGDAISGTLGGDLVKLILTDPPEILVAGFEMTFHARRQVLGEPSPCE